MYESCFVNFGNVAVEIYRYKIFDNYTREITYLFAKFSFTRVCFCSVLARNR